MSAGIAGGYSIFTSEPGRLSSTSPGMFACRVGSMPEFASATSFPPFRRSAFSTTSESSLFAAM